MTLSQIGRAALIDPPTPEQQQYGLLDVATVIEGATWIDPNDLFMSWNCVGVHKTSRCKVPPDNKTFDAGVMIDGAEFALYMGVECRPVGIDWPTAEGRVQAAFNRQESTGVEAAFETDYLQVHMEDVGPAISATQALAFVRSAIAFNYAGVPTIHVGIEAALDLWEARALIERNGSIYTPFGSKVVVGTGYGPNIVYATGEVVILRSPLEVVSGVEQSTNAARVLAERDYIVYSDCAVYGAAYEPTARGGTPTPGSAVNVDTGTDTVSGPGGTWTAPSGNLRNVSIVVTSGSVEVDGDEVTAPNTVNFDADTNESLDPPVVTASSPGDEAVVAWTVIP